MAKKNKSSKAKTAAKGAGVYYAAKKLFKGVFVVGVVAAVGKILRDRQAA